MDGVEMKAQVRAHWEQETCGTRYAETADRRRYFAEISEARYRLEPYIPGFADFPRARGRRVLEIGVGAGADFVQWCQCADHTSGVDLTDAAVQLTGERLTLAGLDPGAYDLQVADAESLPFPDGSFDLVYSWGVLHHTPNTVAAFSEAARVLRPGGEFRGMIYHVPSWTGWLLAGELMVRRRTLRFSPRRAMAELLESPGTKAYSLSEARSLLSDAGFTDCTVAAKLAPGDLLTVRSGARYQGRIMRVLWRLYPRPLVRLLGDRFGTNLLITARRA